MEEIRTRWTAWLKPAITALKFSATIRKSPGSAIGRPIYMTLTA